MSPSDLGGSNKHSATNLGSKGELWTPLPEVGAGSKELENIEWQKLKTENEDLKKDLSDLRKSVEGVLSEITKIKEYEERLQALDNRLKKADKDIKEKLEDFSKETANIRKEFIGIFGIFAGIMTFVSLEFKILQSVSSFSKLAALSMLLVAIIITMIASIKFIFIDRLINTSGGNDKKSYGYFFRENLLTLLVIALFLVLAGCFMYYDLNKEFLGIKRKQKPAIINIQSSGY